MYAPILASVRKLSWLSYIKTCWLLRCHTELSEESSDLNINKIGMTDIKLLFFMFTGYIYKYI